MECLGSLRLSLLVKWPSSVHGAGVFVNSRLRQVLRDPIVPRCPGRLLEDEDPVGVFLLGDPAYPLHPHVNLMKEYNSGGFTGQEQYFGLQLCLSHMVIECALGRLKARFGMLKCALDVNMMIYRIVYMLILFCTSFAN